MASTQHIVQSDQLADQSLSRNPRTRIYDPTFLDASYLQLKRTSHLDPVNSFGYLFVYNARAGVTHPRMIEHSDESEKNALIATLPAIMGPEAKNPHWHIWSSTVIVDVSIEMLPVENTTVGASGRGPGSKRLHWCVYFGPSTCPFNSKGLVPDRVAIPGSDRFAELYAIGRALEKAYEMFSYAKGVKPIRASLGGGRRKQVELGRESGEYLMKVTNFVVLVGDQPLMRWLGEDFDTMEACEVVETLCGNREMLSAESTEHRKAVQMVEWVTKLVQKLEMELHVIVNFWGIYEGAQVLSERKYNREHNPEMIRVRSPSPEPPLLSTLRVGGPSAANASQGEDCIADADMEGLSLDQDDCSRTTSNAQTGRANNSPACSSSSLSTKGLRSSLSSLASSPPSRHRIEILETYILRKYPGNPINVRDIPWTTDKEVLRQQSQILQIAPVVAKQKRKREGPLTTHLSSRQYPQGRKRMRRVIVDVPVGPDGKELSKELIRGKWKGPKMRKVVEIEVVKAADTSSNDIKNILLTEPPTTPAIDDSQTALRTPDTRSKIICPFNMNRAWIHRRNGKSMLHAESPVIPAGSPGIANSPDPKVVLPKPALQKPKFHKSLVNRIKDADYETSDTVDDETVPAAQKCGDNKAGLALRQVKVLKAGTRTQPKRGRVPIVDPEGSPLPRMVTWDTRTTIPVNHG